MRLTRCGTTHLACQAPASARAERACETEPGCTSGTLDRWRSAGRRTQAGSRSGGSSGCAVCRRCSSTGFQQFAVEVREVARSGLPTAFAARQGTVTPSPPRAGFGTLPSICRSEPRLERPLASRSRRFSADARRRQLAVKRPLAAPELPPRGLLDTRAFGLARSSLPGPGDFVPNIRFTLARDLRARRPASFVFGFLRRHACCHPRAFRQCLDVLDHEHWVVVRITPGP
jgi:hypothetical protein